eukprot:COSAG01_NODE_4647_length_4852_cov_3.841153_4_plen_257_part_00
MVDTCGTPAMPPPHGPPPGAVGGQGRWEMTKWHSMIAAKQAQGAKPVLLHDCHIGCTSNFAGPTLAVKKCNASDPAQQWAFETSGNHSALVDQARGLCAGCGMSGLNGCGNGARTGNASAVGLGMQACLIGPVDMGVAGQGPNTRLSSLGAGQQLFNISNNGTIRVRGRKGSLGSCLGQAPGGGDQVVQGFGPHEFCDQGWIPQPSAGITTAQDEGAGLVSLQLKASPDLCLSAAGAEVPPSIDPWCIENNNSELA